MRGGWDRRDPMNILLSKWWTWTIMKGELTENRDPDQRWKISLRLEGFYSKVVPWDTRTACMHHDLRHYPNSFQLQDWAQRMPMPFSKRAGLIGSCVQPCNYQRRRHSFQKRGYRGVTLMSPTYTNHQL